MILIMKLTIIPIIIHITMSEAEARARRPPGPGHIPAPLIGEPPQPLLPEPKPYSHCGDRIVPKNLRENQQNKTTKPISKGESETFKNCSCLVVPNVCVGFLWFSLVLLVFSKDFLVL